MFKLKLQGSVIISRPIDDVWAYIGDITNAREWQPYLVACKQTPADRTGIGTRQWYVFQYLGRRLENQYVITAYEPLKRFEFMSLDGSAIPARGENRFEEVQGGTKLTMFVVPQIGSFFRLVPTLLLGWLYKRTLKSTLRNVKTVLETPAFRWPTNGDYSRHVWWRDASQACGH